MESNDLKLNAQALKRTLKEIEDLKKRAEELRKAHYEYEEIWKKIPILEKNTKKMYSFLNNEKWKLNPELKEIARKLIEAQNNHKIFDKNQDYLLFDEITDDFVSYGKDGKSFHLQLIKTHFRHYDVQTIIDSVERITGKKVKEWYLMTIDSIHRPAWNFSITLVDKDDALGQQEVSK